MTATLHDRAGKCLCGAVRFRAAEMPDELHACHCENCRRSNGVCSMTVVVQADAMTVQGLEAVTTYPSSGWASRSFCSRCGSGLWFRMTTDPDPATADYYISSGLLDDQDGLRLVQEIYIDRKPKAYAFAQPTEKLTGAEFEARYAAGPAASPEE